MLAREHGGARHPVNQHQRTSQDTRSREATMPLKDRLIKLIGETTAGRLEYIVQPNRGQKWGGPFNGQQFRQRIFQDLIATFEFDAIVETGTYRGVTTKYFSNTGLPVHTVEASARYLAYARMNIRKCDAKVTTYHSDSRSFLQELGTSNKISGQQPFIYLDAHWYDDLPLREELEIVQQFWPKAVVMVDDFAVPESTYGYDDYGDGKALTLDYLAPLAPTNLEAFFPSAPAAEETGCRRGSVILASGEVADSLRKIPSLRYHIAVADLRAEATPQNAAA